MDSCSRPARHCAQQAAAGPTSTADSDTNSDKAIILPFPYRAPARYNPWEMWCASRFARAVANTDPAPQASPSADRGDGKSWFAALLETTRPLSSVVVGTLAASAAIAGQGGLTVRSVAAGLSMTTLAMFGFAVNDILDYDKDRAAGFNAPSLPEHCPGKAQHGWQPLCSCPPVSSRRLPVRVEWYWRSPAQRSSCIRRWRSDTPLTKDACVAGLCCLPLFYGAQVGERHYSWFSYAVLAGFVLGREVWMDADELKATPGRAYEPLPRFSAADGRQE